MSPCFQNKFVKNGIVFYKDSFDLPHPPFQCIYEVIRVIDGVPLFLDDHIQRFANSARLQKIDFFPEIIFKNIQLLLHENQYQNGNIKIELYLHDKIQDLFSYYIEHHYPSDVDYKNGVMLKSITAERPDPNAKIVHQDIKLKVSNMLKDSSIYEVLLLTKSNQVTEGSRSNIFFIKNNTVFTAPSDMVLLGITRKYVIQSIKKLFGYQEKVILYNELSTFDAAFLTGTSPMVLPVRMIDDVNYKMPADNVLSILNAYKQIVNDYVKLNK